MKVLKARSPTYYLQLLIFKIPRYFNDSNIRIERGKLKRGNSGGLNANEADTEKANTAFVVAAKKELLPVCTCEILNMISNITSVWETN